MQLGNTRSERGAVGLYENAENSRFTAIAQG
jgi:hypothetical protein